MKSGLRSLRIYILVPCVNLQVLFTLNMLYFFWDEECNFFLYTRGMKNVMNLDFVYLPAIVIIIPELKIVGSILIRLMVCTKVYHGNQPWVFAYSPNRSWVWFHLIKWDSHYFSCLHPLSFLSSLTSIKIVEIFFGNMSFYRPIVTYCPIFIEDKLHLEKVWP